MDSCDFELVKKIMASEEVISNGEGEIIVKAVPDNDKTGMMDKREFFIRSAIYAFQKSAPMKFSIEGMRQTTKTYCKDMCSKPIAEDSFDIDVKGRSVKVFSYVLDDRKYEMLPAMIYVHGGSFMASKAEYYKEPCRYVAENLGVRVFNVDYSLAPENIYPAAIEDVLAALEKIYADSASLGVDKEHIGFFGDSAGANLVLAAILDNKTEAKITYAGLFYPCVDLYSRDRRYDWDISMYDICEEQKELITSRDVSPIYADLSGMPYTGIFTAEYDGLRIQSEYYSRLLDKAGIPNKHIRYRGVSHAFLDYFGIVPQAQAALLEMCDQLRKVWGI